MFSRNPRRHSQSEAALLEDQILFSYMPTNKDRWSEVLTGKREGYQLWVKQLNDEYVSNNSDEDRTLLDQIDKDVRRTFPCISFFRQKALGSQPHPRSIFSSRNDLDFGYLGHISGADDATDCHWEKLERLLWVYAKLNRGTSYVQGMNEVAAVVYYVLGSSGDKDAEYYAEEDTFYLFHEIMNEFRDFYITSMDKDNSTGTGIGAWLNKLSLRMRDVCPDIHAAFESRGIEPIFYAFQWLTCFFTKEFDLPDVIRLWDIIFADLKSVRSRGDPGWRSRRFGGEGDFMIDFAAAMLVAMKGDLLSRSFSQCVHILQNNPLEDIDQVLEIAHDIHHRPFPSKADSTPRLNRPKPRSLDSSHSRSLLGSASVPASRRRFTLGTILTGDEPVTSSEHGLQSAPPTGDLGEDGGKWTFLMKLKSTWKRLNEEISETESPISSKLDPSDAAVLFDSGQGEGGKDAIQSN